MYERTKFDILNLQLIFRTLNPLILPQKQPETMSLARL